MTWMAGALRFSLFTGISTTSYRDHVMKVIALLETVYENLNLRLDNVLNILLQ